MTCGAAVCDVRDDLHHDRRRSLSSPALRLRVLQCTRTRHTTLPQETTATAMFTIMTTYLRRPRLMKVIRHSSIIGLAQTYDPARPEFSFYCRSLGAAAPLACARHDMCRRCLHHNMFWSIRLLSSRHDHTHPSRSPCF